MTTTGDERLDYRRMVDSAMRAVVRDALIFTAEHGLPGNHHFYITFRTDRPDVTIPDHLRGQYPETMTIVLQNQFWGLQVDDEAFAVTLAFRKVRERLFVSFAAVTAFADPDVNFALQFDLAEGEGDGAGTADDAFPEASQGDILAIETRAARTGEDEAKPADSDNEDDQTPRPSAEVVTLDAFRNKT